MPGPPSGRICPICDSLIDRGDKKCSFCGTDLSIFEVEIEEAFKEEERLVEETFSELVGEAKEEKIEEQKEIEEEQPDAIEAAEPTVEEEAEGAKEPAVEEAELAFECPACGGTVSESDKTCPNCGAIFTEEEAHFECPACNALVSANAMRCPGCGALFIEEELAAESPEIEQVAEAHGPEMAAEPSGASLEEAKEAVSVATEEEGALKQTIAAAKEKRERETIARARAAEVANEKETPKVKGLFKGFGFFKELFSREGEPEIEKPVPEKSIPAKQKPKEGLARISLKKPSISPADEAAAEISVPKPELRREIPKEPREQGKALAKIVAEVRALLSLAKERDIDIEESEQLIDRAIMAGRERHFIQALESVSESEQKLHDQFAEYLQSLVASLKEECAVAKKLGGTPSRAKVFLKEATRAAAALDFQAALVFTNKAKSELKPITGRYNETRNALERFKRLIRDARVIGIDREPHMKTLEEAKSAFESLDFESAEKLIRESTEEVIAQIPEKMSNEIEKAKQMLIEAKIRTEKSISPQITILKSVRWALKEEKYLDALAEMKRFKKEMKTLLS